MAKKSRKKKARKKSKANHGKRPNSCPDRRPRGDPGACGVT